MIEIQESQTHNGYIVCAPHPAMESIIYDWTLTHDSVLIDGAIVDPQFMEKTPVGLLCRDRRMAEWVRELIESKDLK